MPGRSRGLVTDLRDVTAAGAREAEEEERNPRTLVQLRQVSAKLHIAGGVYQVRFMHETGTRRNEPADIICH